MLSPLSRERLSARAFTVYLDVGVETAWNRVRGSDRPLAKREADFRKLYEARQAVYAEAADASAASVEDVLLAALRITVPGGIFTSGPAVVVADERVLRLHPPASDRPVLTVPAGEAAKSLAVVERLWRELTLAATARSSRSRGSTTYLAGSSRDLPGGIRWIAVPPDAHSPVEPRSAAAGITLPTGEPCRAFHFSGFLQHQPGSSQLFPQGRRAGMARCQTDCSRARVWKLK